ncbi:MAG TPA: type II secretion system F family protein [Xanthobacteraceae bacterium]
MSDLSIIILLIFLAATFSIYGFYWIFVFNRREQQTVNRRLELSKQLRNSSAVLAELRAERGIRNVDDPRLRQISDWLTQTGTHVGNRTFIVALSATFLILAAASSKFLGLGFAAVIIAIVLTIVFAILFLIRQRSRRVALFGEQLPDTIDVIVRGVRVGLPFISAVALVAREMPDPVGTEFGMLADEIGFGLDVRSALDNLYRRVGQPDLLFLTVSVSIQTQTGGNLGEILSRLSRLMRNRANMRLKIRALSAEGRASALTLSAFPFILLFIINLISPTYYGAIQSNPLVEPAIYLGLFFLLVGNLIMYRMINFKY